MAQRSIREHQAKELLNRHWATYGGPLPVPGERLAQIASLADLESAAARHPWLTALPLAVKPDVLAGRRGKHGLILLDVAWSQAANWLKVNLGTWTDIGGIRGCLTHFLVEPFEQAHQELYLAIKTERHADVVTFSLRGGVDIEEHWQEVQALELPVWPRGARPDWQAWLARSVPGTDIPQLAAFIDSIYRYFVDLGFTFLEINPLAVTSRGLVPLDLKCRLDDAAHFEAGDLWHGIEFPTPFGREWTPEEQSVSDLDVRSGASLKLTVLNPDGLLWTLVAGGGASVVYTDTIADMGFASQLANYGEYSGNPSADEAYEYARTVLELMTRARAPSGRSKHLLIGGGIANFTDVAQTFTGIIRALREAQERLRSTPARIWVRRGGPNYQEGLRLMEALGEEIGIPVAVFGPETHMTRIVSMAVTSDDTAVGGEL